MGKADTAVKNWLDDNERFADLFNGTVFGGEQVIFPDELENLDRETDILITDKRGNDREIRRHRDLVKRWRKEVDLAVLACENQDKIHYAMPVRGMFHLHKELKDMQILKQYIPNYRINLVDAGNIQSPGNFHSDLQQIFGMLKYRGEKEQMRRYVQENRRYFECVDVETYQALRVFLHSERMMKNMANSKKEEKIDMCQALEDLYNDGIKEGRAEAREEGVKKFVRSCYNLEIPKEKMISQLILNYELTEDEARKYVDKS